MKPTSHITRKIRREAEKFGLIVERTNRLKADGILHYRFSFAKDRHLKVKEVVDIMVNMDCYNRAYAFPLAEGVYNSFKSV